MFLVPQFFHNVLPTTSSFCPANQPFILFFSVNHPFLPCEQITGGTPPHNLPRIFAPVVQTKLTPENNFYCFATGHVLRANQCPKSSRNGRCKKIKFTFFVRRTSFPIMQQLFKAYNTTL
jgi:hypothetical protein